MLGALVLLTQLASAEPQLRGPHTESEQEALAFRDLVEEMGFEPLVMRSYQHGSGWEYRVWVSGFDSADAAREAARVLAERGGRGVDVMIEGRATERPLPAPLAELPSAVEVRSRVARALGGASGGLQQLRDAKSLLFSFSRTLPEAGIKAKHRLLRAASYQRLEISQLTEVGSDLLAIRGPQGDWFREKEGMKPVAADQMDALFERVGPETIYAGILALPQLLLEDLEYLELQVVGQEVVDFRNAIRLESQTRHGKMVLLVEVGSWLPRSLAFYTEGGRSQRVFVGWRAVESNLVLPGLMEVRREGQLLDRIYLDKIQLSPAHSASEFSPPEMP
jgi:hypothetical protein